MSKSYDVAVVGAANSTGELIVEMLAERKFPIETLCLLADEEAAGGRLEYEGSYHSVKNIVDFDFSQVQIAFFVGDESLSKQFAEKAAKSGCVVIDNSPCFRMDDDVPLVISEVNVQAIAGYTARNIIACPSSAVSQMMIALKPLHDAVGLKWISVSTYHSVSEMGKSGAEALASQTASLLNMQEIKDSSFAKQIAFNVIPQVGAMLDNGYTLDELRLIGESQKILDDKSIAITPTAVWVPVFFGHSEALHIETKKKVTAETAGEILSKASGVEIIDERSPFDCPTAVSDAVGSDAVYIGRIREDICIENGLNLWVVSDNARKGDVLNGVQIAENLIKNYLKE